MTEPIRHLGRYELLRRIAVGGMGEIFLARMRGAAGFEKRVIIKTILGHLAAEEEFVTKFLDEGRTVVQLTHGNIVPVFDMGEEDGEYFIAMEYIPGRDLREILRRLMPQGRGLPVELATYVVSELCKGLDYAHRKEDEQGQLLGIVHRDVSPSNVLISHEGEVKVIDFGIASATSRLAQTVSGRIQGKFCYMSPEQATGARVDERSDIFAAGVVLYELLTNARPFHGANDMETLELVRRCEVDPPSVLDPTIPQEVDAIVMRALQRDREARYPSIDRMQVDLLEYLYTHGQSPTGRDLARFVTGLFEEGFERPELKTPSRSGSSGGGGKRASLDELLEQELGRLSGATPSQPGAIDPWTATAAPKRPSEPRTATLAAPQPLTPSQGRILRQDTRSPEDRTSQDTPTKTPTPAQDTPAPSGPELTPATGSAALTITQVRGIKRAAVAMVVLIGLGVAGGTIASNVMAERRVGFVVVRSEPAGAAIYVDEARVPDARTPHTLELTAGARRIALRKEGFEPSDAFGVKVKAGQTIPLTDAPITLRPLAPSPTPQPRRFTIRTSPSEVELSVNGERVGLTPRIIEVRDGEPANLAFSRQGCEPANYVLVASQRHDEVKVNLSCEEAPERASATTPQQPASDQPQPPRHQAKRELRVTANVAGAQVKIDGQAVGAAPARATVSGRGRVRVEVTHPEHEPYSRTLSVAEIPASGLSVTLAPLPMGCLDFSILRPRHNALFIDGAPLGRHSYLKGHPVAVGTHTLRIVNEVARFERSVSFKVKPGPSCALVSLGEEASSDAPQPEPGAP